MSEEYSFSDDDKVLDSQGKAVVDNEKNPGAKDSLDLLKSDDIERNILI